MVENVLCNSLWDPGTQSERIGNYFIVFEFTMFHCANIVGLGPFELRCQEHVLFTIYKFNITF